MSEQIFNLEPDIKIKAYDHQGKSINEFSELYNESEKNKLDVFLTFNVLSVDTEIWEDRDVAKYCLVDFDSRDSYLKNKKIALIRNIHEKKPATSGVDIFISKNENGMDDLQCKMFKKPVNNDLKDIDFHLVKTRTSESVQVKKENVTIFAYFNLPRKIEFDEIITFPSPQKPKEPF